MPISYRAGSASSHAHTIFQGIVDAITGHPHHHAANLDAGPAESPAPSPFVPLTVPLGSWPASHTGTSTAASAEARDAEISQVASPDIPERMGLYSPLESTSAIHDLGSLVALLLAGTIRPSLWGSVNRLFTICPPLEPPPPRLASA